MIQFGAIQVKVGRISRMPAAQIEGIGGPSRTEAEHPQPRFNLKSPILNGQGFFPALTFLSPQNKYTGF